MYMSFASSILWIGDTRQWSWQCGRESMLPTHIYETSTKGYEQPNSYTNEKQDDESYSDLRHCSNPSPVEATFVADTRNDAKAPQPIVDKATSAKAYGKVNASQHEDNQVKNPSDNGCMKY